jgi:hypothetical protein
MSGELGDRLFEDRRKAHELRAVTFCNRIPLGLDPWTWRQDLVQNTFAFLPSAGMHSVSIVDVTTNK